jgi:hypothetical protein
MPRRGVIYTVAPSFIDINTIWVGTDDGLIHITKDGGKTWKNVTPPEVGSWSKVSIMEASHTDVNIAYAAVNRIRCDDMHPHIYKTNDGGKSWKQIVNGLPNDPINTVREDPKKKGLLFAGSERAVYISFDDGEHWQSLRLNMPATSIRDLVIKDDDLVVGTHGRSFWILDDISALRQLSNQTIKQPTTLFKPQTATRVRWDMWTDTPLPQEEPAGQNPPDGAIIDYYLSENARDVSLTILDAKGNSVRHFTNHDTMYKIPPLNIPLYWIRPQQILSGEKGSHRFLWDMHYAPLNLPPSYPIGAIYKNTAPAETSPWVMPGTYTVRFNVDGKIFSQQLTVKIDPRVKTAAVDLQKQHDLSLVCYQGTKKCTDALEEIRKYKTGIQDSAKIRQLTELENTPQGSQAPSFGRLNGNFASLQNILQETEMPPTTQTIKAVADSQKRLADLLKKWNELKGK